jgi:hypothetical protein
LSVRGEGRLASKRERADLSARGKEYSRLVCPRLISKREKRGLSARGKVDLSAVGEGILVSKREE